MKPLTIYDYEEIKDFLELADYEGYNSNFVTMMMWNHEYHIEYEIHEHFLVMLHRYENEQFWSMPFTNKEYYKEAIDYMIKYSNDHHFSFKIDCAISTFVEELKRIYPSKFIYKRQRDFDDYIYDKNMHKNLTGKKMQKRRNHFNYFIKSNSDFEYRDLNFISDFNDVLKCLSKWSNDKKEVTKSIISEIYGIMYLFSWRELLNVKAGGIYINNELEAFIIASPLNHNTIQIIIEKANINIRGLYPAILKMFLENNFEHYEYINREEDMGLENLRKSKMSLHPIKMIEKYRVLEKNLKIENASVDDEQILKEIWERTFIDETKKSSEFYFKNLYKKENMYILKNNDEIISGMQIVPFNISNKKINQPSFFVLGVFTKKEYEGQGLMKKLFKYVLSLKKYNNHNIYLQAYNPLIYKTFGFEPSHYHYIYTPDYNYYITYNQDTFDDIDYKELKKLYDNFVSDYNEYRIRDENYFKMLIKRCIAFDQEIRIFKNKEKIEGYAIFSNNEELYVNEIIYDNQNALNRIIATLFNINSNLKIECDLKTNVIGNKEKIITMLSNSIDNNNYFENKFINEVY